MPGGAIWLARKAINGEQFSNKAYDIAFQNLLNRALEMNRKTAVLDYIIRRQRNRRIKLVLFAVVIAGLMGWALTFSQQQAFSLTPAAPGQAAQGNTTTAGDEAKTENEQ